MYNLLWRWDSKNLCDGVSVWLDLCILHESIHKRGTIIL